MEQILYFDLQHAIDTHDQILKISGGRPGILDKGRLDSILEHVQNDQYYPSIVEKLTHLVFQVNKGHCFNDGNKRTSIALGAFFLIINGLAHLADHFIIQMENIAVSVADNLISRELLEEIIQSLLTESDFNESLKLKIIEAINGTFENLETDNSADVSPF